MTDGIDHEALRVAFAKAYMDQMTMEMATDILNKTPRSFETTSIGSKINDVEFKDGQRVSSPMASSYLAKKILGVL